MPKIKVLIVDDSAVIRQLLKQILSSDPAIDVVGVATDPVVAREKILRLQPDVLTLDVEMPRMDGLTFLEKLMRAHPLPVVMISSLTERGCETTLRALELGAVDFVSKPKIDVVGGTVHLADEIVEKVKSAAQAKIIGVRRKLAATPVRLLPSQALIRSTHQVIAVGASTGGTEALREMLEPFPPDAPGIVMVQHMPEKFTRSFADRLDSLCRIRVKEAQDGDRILPGHALLAPGNFHMEVLRSGAEYRVRVFSADPVNRHRPSVDVLFHSCAKYLGSNAVGVILTGMGADGARGMLEMRRAGARTIAQDEASCVVFGMPKEAIAMGGAEEVLPLGQIPAGALRMASAPLQRV
ncbi:MAG TPA: chemotaxis response regulator protein-glutamate methylesterase [Bryobacteraceae bacterium]|nr:chemotaxis response regulator protein-glutamate methylesterase [Bryobacteraceae bacterium]